MVLKSAVNAATKSPLGLKKQTTKEATKQRASVKSNKNFSDRVSLSDESIKSKSANNMLLEDNLSSIHELSHDAKKTRN